MRRLITILLALTALLTMILPAWAAEGNVTYQSNAREFIFEPGSKHSPTDLFPNFKGVMPGDTLRQRITVYNDRKNKVKIKLYLRSLGADDPESRDFLSQMRLTVSNASDTVYFDAPADESAQLTDWVYLGTLYSSGKCDLDVVLHVPESMDNEYQERIGFLDWEFMVEERPTSPDDPPPKTGDVFPVSNILLVMVCSGLGLVILAFCRRRRNGNDT